MIKITQTEKEYLLQIPIAQKERAKEIAGRIWDPERKVWVYRRTKNMYNALLAEFGDDLRRIDITAPDSDQVIKKPEDLEKENTKLQKQIEQINKNLEALCNAQSGEEKVAAHQQTIADKQSTINELNKQLDTARLEHKKLNEQIKHLSEKLAQQTEQDRSHSFEEDIKKFAIMSTDNDKIFERELNKIGINETFPDEFHKILMKILQIIANEKSRKVGLYDLLEQVKDAERMDKAGLDMAHAIRNQRNALKHHEIDPKTRQTRILYLVMAYALLWPYLMDALEDVE